MHGCSGCMHAPEGVRCRCGAHTGDPAAGWPRQGSSQRLCALLYAAWWALPYLPQGRGQHLERVPSPNLSSTHCSELPAGRGGCAAGGG
jgi:hypothetical protein